MVADDDELRVWRINRIKKLSASKLGDYEIWRVMTGKLERGENLNEGDMKYFVHYSDLLEKTVAVGNQMEKNEAMTTPPKRSSKPYVYGGIGAAVAIIAILAIIPMLAQYNYNSGGGGGNSYTPVYVPTQHTISVVNSMVHVNSGTYVYYTISAPAGSTDAYVSGTFTAGGGSGNDIRVYILDEQSFVNWRNGHQGSAYYNSGQETVGSINANIPSGQTFYLIYDNSFSIFSAKEVTTNVSLTYTS